MTDDQKNNPQPEGQPVPVEESLGSAPAAEEPIPGESQQGAPAEEAVPCGGKARPAFPLWRSPSRRRASRPPRQGKPSLWRKIRPVSPLWRSPSQGRASRAPLSQGPRREGSPTRPSLGRGGITARPPQAPYVPPPAPGGYYPYPQGGYQPQPGQPLYGQPAGQPAKPPRKKMSRGLKVFLWIASALTVGVGSGLCRVCRQLGGGRAPAGGLSGGDAARGKPAGQLPGGPGRRRDAGD